MRTTTILSSAALIVALAAPQVASAQHHRPTHVSHHEAGDRARTTARHYQRAQRQLAIAERDLVELQFALQSWDAPGIERLVAAGLEDVENARFALAVDRIDVAYEHAVSAEERAERAARRLDNKLSRLETLRDRTIATVQDANTRTGRRASLSVQSLVDEATRLCERGERAMERGNFARAEQRFEASLARVEDARVAQEIELREQRNARANRGGAPAGYAPAGYAPDGRRGDGYFDARGDGYFEEPASCPFADTDRPRRGRSI